MPDPHPLRLVVHGAAGRMGRRIVACAAEDAGRWQLVAAIDRFKQGTDAGELAGSGRCGVAINEAWDAAADVVIDFSLPGAVAGIASACAERRVPLVVATTGLEPGDEQAIEKAAGTIPPSV